MVPVDGDKEEWDVAGIGAQKALQSSPNKDE